MFFPSPFPSPFHFSSLPLSLLSYISLSLPLHFPFPNPPLTFPFCHPNSSVFTPFLPPSSFFLSLLFSSSFTSSLPFPLPTPQSLSILHSLTFPLSLPPPSYFLSFSSSHLSFFPYLYISPLPHLISPSLPPSLPYNIISSPLPSPSSLNLSRTRLTCLSPSILTPQVRLTASPTAVVTRAGVARK